MAVKYLGKISKALLQISQVIPSSGAFLFPILDFFYGEDFVIGCV
jgi:hypothetical protein